MDMNSKRTVAGTWESDMVRLDLSNIHVREDLARAGRCANVHLATGRTCLLPLRHHGPCEFHNPQEADDILRR
ncbi:hypothetical protein [Arthrobacter sp. B6]|uniref:hypothetical protein n=1 Tax=Arthrobacter sp. B6 TaxID=1570137 RepID=UPI000AA48AC4|nr:hypothetical protein [Arthrobacter sp. B6]